MSAAPVTADRSNAAGSRAEALRILERVIGAEAIPQWLASRQPAFADRTAGATLQSDPERVLRHLKALEAGLDGEIDAPDEMIDPPQKRSEKETSNVLAILDDLGRGNV